MRPLRIGTDPFYGTLLQQDLSLAQQGFPINGVFWHIGSSGEPCSLKSDSLPPTGGGPTNRIVITRRCSDAFFVPATVLAGSVLPPYFVPASLISPL